MCTIPAGSRCCLCVRADSSRRYIVEAIKNHMVDEDVSMLASQAVSDCCQKEMWSGADSTCSGFIEIPSQMGGLGIQERPDMGAGGQSGVSKSASVAASASSSTSDTEKSHRRESAQDILNDYYERLGGRQSIFEQTEKAARGKKRGRGGSNAGAGPSKRARKNGTHPAETTPPASSSTKSWAPPAGSWEEEIEAIDACEDEGGKKLVVYLDWKNGHKTRHDTSVVYKKCPQKVRPVTCVEAGRGRTHRIADSQGCDNRCWNTTNDISKSSRRETQSHRDVAPRNPRARQLEREVHYDGGCLGAGFRWS